MSPFWTGFAAAFGVVGAIVVVLAIFWLIATFYPEVQWWTIKRLPLQSVDARDRAAAIVAGSRRAYVIRIPFGLRIVIGLGGNYETQQAVWEDLSHARALRDLAAAGKGTRGSS